MSTISLDWWDRQILHFLDPEPRQKQELQAWFCHPPHNRSSSWLQARMQRLRKAGLIRSVRIGGSAWWSLTASIVL